MNKTKIEWADATWNPITGCTKISPGCQNCYAERMSKRLAGRCGYPAEEPFKVTIHPDKIDEPLKWKKPRRVFVCSMSDLFHKEVPMSIITYVLRMARSCEGHTFMILTKRPARMKEAIREMVSWGMWPVPNIWLGVTAENQEQADKRIPILLDTPAAVRFVSVEPMLGPVTFRWAKWQKIKTEPGSVNNHLDGLRRLDWIICGAESGQKARPMQREWALELMRQCQEAGVPFFYKQGPDDNGIICKMPVLDGRVWSEFPL
jgi:protein gp37